MREGKVFQRSDARSSLHTLLAMSAILAVPYTTTIPGMVPRYSLAPARAAL
eukprot:CAMPEP_0181393984 /NCGR_PEP_ID=MMETSP1106-20121128/27501_1 /TAXON_ID=81844 /ORGANISM="Mantoniella antarctica, Strain SL-175" /LENGTH=50 /DNA_ID=CAMNT_0023515381 /DNA_START=43 /DNA_END=192 /DNA_ORIENTATION=+